MAKKRKKTRHACRRSTIRQRVPNRLDHILSKPKNRLYKLKKRDIIIIIPQSLKLRFVLKLAHGKREEPHDPAFIDKAESLVFEYVFLGARNAFDCPGVGVDPHRVDELESAILGDAGGDERGDDGSNGRNDGGTERERVVPRVRQGGAVTGLASEAGVPRAGWLLRPLNQLVKRQTSLLRAIISLHVEMGDLEPGL
jgi:hypothetical protein